METYRIENVRLNGKKMTSFKLFLRKSGGVWPDVFVSTGRYMADGHTATDAACYAAAMEEE